MDAETLLLEVLNSTPTVEEQRTDALADDARHARSLVRAWGGTGSASEIRDVARVRDALQHLIADGHSDDDLSDLLASARRHPIFSEAGLRWDLEVEDDRRLPLALLEAWSAVTDRLPGRLRSCENDECSLFLLDRSRGNAARWCSMATCGNRMKARRHHERTRAARDGD